MARLPRIVLPGIPHHVTQRGNRRERTFFEDGDFTLYLDLLADVAKCTVMLDDMKDWPAFNKVYVTYFPDQKFPARSALGADGLALGALLEIECIAYTGKK
jgi:enamine deaminase RidA (YjgF/YER057c/UK114 family)